MRRWFLCSLGLAFAALPAPGHAIEPIDTSKLVDAVTAEKIMVHLEKFQSIADRFKGTRVVGTAAYKKSVEYVQARLEAAGLDVTVQPFTIRLFSEKNPPKLSRVSPAPETYEAEKDFTTMEYSGAGSVTARLSLAHGIQIPPGKEPSSSSSGCNPGDFGGYVKGRIVLIQRGTCTFFDKASNAEKAGAVGAIIFNEGQEGRTELLNGTLGAEVGIPVVGTTFDLGKELYGLVRADRIVTLKLVVDSKVTPIDTFNVIADLKGERTDRVVVVGSHLDSVDAGPGINDNGSGSATDLTIAEQMVALGINPHNTVRFAFWGAEEEGLLGSNYYVANLAPKQLERIWLNLNFDMLASPNFARLVYDGDGTLGTKGPPGSDVIESVFNDYFKGEKLATKPTGFDGRSDYFAFINAGIPAGGLFSGAEEIKTKAEVKLFGGVAGKPYDKCYHSACDTIDNINKTGLRQLSKGAAHAVMTFAMTKEEIAKRSATPDAAATAAAAAADRRGHHWIR